MLNIEERMPMRPLNVLVKFPAILIVFIVLNYTTALADDSTDKILRATANATAAIQTLSATLTITNRTRQGDATYSGPVSLRRPNLARIDVKLYYGNTFSTIASDGKTMWQLTANPQPTQLEVAEGNVLPLYRIAYPDPFGHNITFPKALPAIYFFHTDISPLSPSLLGVKNDVAQSPTYLGRRIISGDVYDVIDEKIIQPYRIDVRLYIGLDHLLRRVEWRLPMTSRLDEVYYIEAKLSQVVLNPEIPASQFVYDLPKGMLPYVDVSRDRLLPIGTKAPDFNIRMLDGENSTLYEILRGKRAVLLDFWFVMCSVCRQEFPALQKLYADLKDQGFEIIGIDAGDSAETISKAIHTLDLLKGTQFPIALTGENDPSHIMDHFGVEGFPTGYLIDSSGKIVYVSCGFDESTGLGDLERALTQMGFKLHDQFGVNR